MAGRAPGRCRKVGRECGSRSIRAGQFQPAVMRLGNPAGDGQTKSCAAGIAFASRARFVRPEKPLENSRLEFRGNPGSSVENAQDVIVSLTGAFHEDFPARGGVLDRVVKKIEQHPPQQIFVGLYWKLRLDSG